MSQECTSSGVTWAYYIMGAAVRPLIVVASRTGTTATASQPPTAARGHYHLRACPMDFSVYNCRTNTRTIDWSKGCQPSRDQNHLKDLLKSDFWPTSPQFLTGGLGWSLRTCIPNKSPDDPCCWSRNPTLRISKLVLPGSCALEQSRPQGASIPHCSVKKAHASAKDCGV